MLNIIEIIEPSIFLNKLYPNGIEKLSIHKIDFMTSSYGNSFIYIYTNQEPQISIPKYGTFGKDYDTVVIELSCRILGVEIHNSSKNKSYLPVEIYRNKNLGYVLKQTWEDGNITLNIDNKFIFQGISTYISE